MNKHKTRAIIAFIFVCLLLLCYVSLLIAHFRTEPVMEDPYRNYRDRVPAEHVTASTIAGFVNISKYSLGAANAYADMYPEWGEIFTDAFYNQLDTQYYIDMWEALQS